MFVFALLEDNAAALEAVAVQNQMRPFARHDAR